MADADAAATVRTVEVGPLPAGPGRVVARFVGVRHSTESFVVRVYLGRVEVPTGAGLDDVDPGAPLAGTVAVYGHGDAYGGQAELDRELAPFDVAVDLTAALRQAPGGDALSLVVVDTRRQVRPASVFRFDEVRIEAQE